MSGEVHVIQQDSLGKTTKILFETRIGCVRKFSVKCDLLWAIFGGTARQHVVKQPPDYTASYFKRPKFVSTVDRTSIS